MKMKLYITKLLIIFIVVSFSTINYTAKIPNSEDATERLLFRISILHQEAVKTQNNLKDITFPADMPYSIYQTQYKTHQKYLQKYLIDLTDIINVLKKLVDLIALYVKSNKKLETNSFFKFNKYLDVITEIIIKIRTYIHSTETTIKSYKKSPTKWDRFSRSIHRTIPGKWKYYISPQTAGVGAAALGLGLGATGLGLLWYNRSKLPSFPTLPAKK